MSAAAPHQHSIPSGDVVLCNLPPYNTQPWLSMGVVLHHALLGRGGIRARVVRPIDPPFAVPRAVAHASNLTLTFDPPMAARLAAMAEAARLEPRFFEGLIDALLAGGEPVIGLSVFRSNVDLTLHVARVIKERRPERRIVIGGPEAIEEPAALRLPWVDVVVGVDAEAVVVPLMRALLDGRTDEATRLAAQPGAPLPSLPTLDYAPLMPLFVGDSEPTVPLLLNWGCPHRCTFCSNATIYSRFVPGSIERVLDEMDTIQRAWQGLHGDRAPQLNLQLSDATTNALPAQLDDLLRGVIARGAAWGQRPYLRGQTLFDARVTEERVRLWAEAGFANTFFGLDGASDGLRRRLQKPGTVEQVLAAMALYQRAGLQGLTFGVPVGVPGETEGDFEDALRFVDRALALGGPILAITALPYLFFLSAQDPSLSRLNHGARRGVLWRTDGPGGDPAERARRYMRLVEHIGGRAPVSTPIPPYMALPAMLPDEDPGRLDEWMARWGREFDQLTPPEQRGVVEIAGSVTWSHAERAFAGLGDCGGWRVDTVERVAAAGATPAALLVRFRAAVAGGLMVLRLEARDAARPAFAQTRDYNVVYQREWRGERCSVDEALIRRCVVELVRAETTATPTSSP